MLLNERKKDDEILKTYNLIDSLSMEIFVSLTKTTLIVNQSTIDADKHRVCSVTRQNLIESDMQLDLNPNFFRHQFYPQGGRAIPSQELTNLMGISQNGNEKRGAYKYQTQIFQFKD